MSSVCCQKAILFCGLFVFLLAIKLNDSNTLFSRINTVQLVGIHWNKDTLLQRSNSYCVASVNTGTDLMDLTALNPFISTSFICDGDKCFLVVVFFIIIMNHTSLQNLLTHLPLIECCPMKYKNNIFNGCFRWRQSSVENCFSIYFFYHFLIEMFGCKSFIQSRFDFFFFLWCNTHVEVYMRQ